MTKRRGPSLSLPCTREHQRSWSNPFLGLTSGRAVAYEALSRFTHGGPRLPPDQWFGLAHRVGLGATFEARAVDLALRAGHARPTGTVLSINVSPSVLSSRELHDVLPFDLSGLQFEITEKEVVEDPTRLTEVLDALRRRGARIAVDDVGEGYAGLQRVMSICPDLLKLDRSLVTGVEAEVGQGGHDRGGRPLRGKGRRGSLRRRRGESGRPVRTC